MPPWWLLGIGFTHVQILSQYAGSGLFHRMAGLPVSTDVAWFVGMGANILVLLACGAVFRGPRLDRLKRLLAPSIILNIVGFLLSVWPTGVTANDDPVALLGAIALGMGQAIMLLLWADVFNRAKIEEAEIALPLSSLVVLAYAVVVPLLPASLNGIPMLVAPLASGATLYLSFQRLPVAQACEKAVAIEGSRPHSMVKELARIAVPLAVFYLVVSWNGLLSQFEMTGERSLPEIIGSLAGVLCIVVFVLFSLKIDFAALFRWLCPLATLALILNFWKSPASAMAVCSISSVLDITIWIVTYLYSSRMARRDYGTSLTRIAVLLAVSHGGATVGNILAVAVLADLAQQGAMPQSISLVLVCLLVATTMVVVGRPALRVAADWRNEDGAAAPNMSARCKAISEQHGLTARELDVLLLLAAGRSQPYICDYLVLSKSTVSTHVSHIYQKCSVHSRQELLDLVNE